ncbi:hypothetical protein ABT009_10245 [Streptomyces sp. NPDC002896]|uniref:hypothetical protein n=1 Tax=Streptomyces sp. NPDC002896 TaxID=3154438 RepID=UPI00332064F8
MEILLLLASFALTGYAGVRLLAGNWLAVAAWFVGAALVHDLVLVPLYSLADRGLQEVVGGGRSRRRDLINFVRVPALLSGLLLLVWFPLISRHVERRYALGTGLSADVFLSRWLLVSAALFAISALWLVARMWRTARWRGTGPGPERARSATKGRPPADH